MKLPALLILITLTTLTGLKVNRTKVRYRIRYNYGEIIRLSLFFIEAQRSGRLPPNNRLPWRGNSMLNDTGDDGVDLTGGYYNAGEIVKFTFPVASAFTVFGWGMLEYMSGYEKAGEVDNAFRALQWAADYFMKAHPEPTVLYGLVGDTATEQTYWGRPEDYTGPRPAFKLTREKPGSELAGETAAALAVISMLLRKVDKEYADKCLRHAEELYDFANAFRAKYSDSIPQVVNHYNSWSGYEDELVWSALWLHRATGKPGYLQEAKSHYYQFNLNSTPGGFNWDDKKAGVQVLLAKITNDRQFIEDATGFCEHVLTQVPRTPKGLAYVEQWGALRHAANVAFICMQVGDLGIHRDRNYGFAREQIGYMLGDTGRSFVVGYGRNPPQRPHHRASSCPSKPEPCGWEYFHNPAPNPQILTGALVGGPDKDDQYADVREDFVKNAVSLDYNAGFTSAVAGLYQHYSSL